MYLSTKFVNCSAKFAYQETCLPSSRIWRSIRLIASLIVCFQNRISYYSTVKTKMLSFDCHHLDGMVLHTSFIFFLAKDLPIINTDTYIYIHDLIFLKLMNLGFLTSRVQTTVAMDTNAEIIAKLDVNNLHNGFFFLAFSCLTLVFVVLYYFFLVDRHRYVILFNTIFICVTLCITLFLNFLKETFFSNGDFLIFFSICFGILFLFEFFSLHMDQKFHFFERVAFSLTVVLSESVEAKFFTHPLWVLVTAIFSLTVKDFFIVQSMEKQFHAFTKVFESLLTVTLINASVNLLIAGPDLSNNSGDNLFFFLGFAMIFSFFKNFFDIESEWRSYSLWRISDLTLLNLGNIFNLSFTIIWIFLCTLFIIQRYFQLSIYDSNLLKLLTGTTFVRMFLQLSQFLPISDFVVLRFFIMVIFFHLSWDKRIFKKKKKVKSWIFSLFVK